MDKLNLEIVKGNTFSKTFSVTQNGAAVDLTGTTIKFMVKNSLIDADIDALITFQVSSFTDNTFTIILNSTETNLTPKKYVYEVRFDTANTKVTKLLGDFNILQNVIKS